MEIREVGLDVPFKNTRDGLYEIDDDYANNDVSRLTVYITRFCHEVEEGKEVLRKNQRMEGSGIFSLFHSLETHLQTQSPGVVTRRYDRRIVNVHQSGRLAQ